MTSLPTEDKNSWPCYLLIVKPIAILLLLLPLFSLSSQDFLTLVPGKNILSTADADRLLSRGMDRNMDFIMVLDELAPLLVREKKRLIIPAPVLGHILKTYELDKWGNLQIFLPLSKLTSLELGAPLEYGDNLLDLTLEKDYSGTSPLGDFFIEKKFGFKSHRTGRFSDAFGVYAVQFYARWSLDYLDLYEPLKVALHIKGFFRPKKYDIHPLIKK